MDFNYDRNVNRQMKDSWHIPRASLGGSSGSSSNSSSKSNSNPPTITGIHSRHLLHNHNRNLDNDRRRHRRQQHHQQLKTATTTNLEFNNNTDDNLTTTNTSRNQNYRNSYDSNSVNNNNTNNKFNHNFKMYTNKINGDSSAGADDDSSGGIRLSNLTNKNVNNIGSIKRSSRSSQGSTDSHSSSRSASSGSLLLTAANLERFVAIHNKTQLQQSELFKLHHHLNGHNYNSNITQNPLGINDDANDGNNIEKAPKSGVTTTTNHYTTDTVISIDDPNLNFIKTKDVDTMSIASSTHFTMVNGVGGPQKKIRSGICSRGHQITVLILTMSSFFLIGILLMVFLMEMRAREMPQQ